MDYENLTPQYRIEEYLEAIVEGWVDATLVAYPEVPSWRIEEFLDAFITYIWEDGDHPRHPCPDPVWRLEECLRAIYDVMTGAATPWAFPLPTTNRIEEYLAAIHAYLADGTELPVPEPVWRIEQWLAYALDAVKQGGGVATTVSGTMAHITNALAKPALSVLVSIAPIQDLHGYANPWPAGGGVNKLPPTVAETKSENSLSCTSDGNGNFTFSGTLSGTFNQTFTDIGTAYVIQSGDYLHCLNSVASSSVLMYLYFTDNTNTYAILSTTNKIHSLSGNEGKTVKAIRFYVGAQYNATVSPMIVNSGASTAFEPWENICPISGLTGLSVYVSPTQDPDDATIYNVDLSTQAGTVYGGTVDVVSGVLTVTMANIASYNGETIGEPWVSSMDAYASRTTPTTGAQVVYTLATPQTYQLTPQEVQMLLGENYLWSSSGDTVSVTYYAEGNANPLQSLNILLGGNYSNPKTADDVSDKEALDIILGR